MPYGESRIMPKPLEPSVRATLSRDPIENMGVRNRCINGKVLALSFPVSVGLLATVGAGYALAQPGNDIAREEYRFEFASAVDWSAAESGYRNPFDIAAAGPMSPPQSQLGSVFPPTEARGTTSTSGLILRGTPVVWESSIPSSTTAAGAQAGGLPLANSDIYGAPGVGTLGLPTLAFGNNIWSNSPQLAPIPPALPSQTAREGFWVPGTGTHAGEVDYLGTDTSPVPGVTVPYVPMQTPQFVGLPPASTFSAQSGNPFIPASVALPTSSAAELIPGTTQGELNSDLTTASALDAGAPGQPLTEPTLNLQGLYILQGDRSSARARVTGTTFITPNLMVGGTVDFVTGPDLTNSDGIQVTELYLAASVPNRPELRLRIGQLDLTSYFDRNSFAKDISRDFFNSTFHTNPALIAGANATASRPAGLVQWSVTDDITLSAAAFSSAPNLSDFALDGFAGEVGFRTGNLILRGTYVSAKDTEFQGTGERLQSYGVNAEYFFPDANLGLFGRYGHLDNNAAGLSTDTYSVGMNLLDVFMQEDRLGLAYGRNLDTFAADGQTPDVLEAFYDFELLPNIRAGFTFQQRNSFTESFLGFRVRGDLNLLPNSATD